ncbi:MAG: adenine-specific methyltransferase EcoRI family protein [Oscillospiraceae bacterium]|nr:adenine-specific methyltransferase EcoRI family protein [Oscillospiraceae bacterium]
MPNKRLTGAKKEKNDEFYTTREVIDAELRHYIKQFKDKTVFCNCDDPYESNFFKYFAMNFEQLGLKKLIATSFSGSTISGTQLSLLDVKIQLPSEACKIELTNVKDIHTLDDVKNLVKQNVKSLNGNGDFLSDECVELLKESDIVVTNPPFSLFKEFITQLLKYNKQFLIIGNKNCLIYKEVFAPIKAGKMWLGYRNINSDMWFIVPEHYKCEKIINGVRMKHIMGCWLTNLDVLKRHEEMLLYRTYDTDAFPTYDNYNAIEVNEVKNIPKDYYGLMGVPSTFLGNYNPDQFELIGVANDKREKHPDFIQANPVYLDDRHKSFQGLVVNGKATYARIVIKRKVKK